MCFCWSGRTHQGKSGAVSSCSPVPDLICFQIRLLIPGSVRLSPSAPCAPGDPSGWGTLQARRPVHPSPRRPGGALAGVSYAPCRPVTDLSQAHGVTGSQAPGWGVPGLLSGAPFPLFKDTHRLWVIPTYSRPSFCLPKTSSRVRTPCDRLRKVLAQLAKDTVSHSGVTGKW